MGGYPPFADGIRKLSRKNHNFSPNNTFFWTISLRIRGDQQIILNSLKALANFWCSLGVFLVYLWKLLDLRKVATIDLLLVQAI